VETIILIFKLFSAVAGGILINKTTEIGEFKWIKQHLKLSWTLYFLFLSVLFFSDQNIWREVMKLHKQFSSQSPILQFIVIFIIGGMLLYGYWQLAGFFSPSGEQSTPTPIPPKQPSAEEIAAEVAKRIHTPKIVVLSNPKHTEISKLNFPPTTEDKQISTLPKANAIPPPHSPSLTSEVTFDYSSHDGRFKFGNGDLVFESMWGSASNTRIHCYNDYLSGIAVAPIGADFGSLGDVSKLDFTSRVRSPVVGQFVILKNTKGFFALLLIMSIRDTTHGDLSDELKFHYWIRPDGGSNFSNESIKPRV
jgi:hypothetical protein